MSVGHVISLNGTPANFAANKRCNKGGCRAVVRPVPTHKQKIHNNSTSGVRRESSEKIDGVNGSGKTFGALFARPRLAVSAPSASTKAENFGDFCPPSNVRYGDVNGEVGRSSSSWTILAG